MPVSYELRYYEDIRGTGLSFTTVVGETNVQGEISFLDGTPMVNAAGDPEREDFLKLQLGGAHLFGPNFLADSSTITFEAFYAEVTSADSGELIEDDHAFGYSVLADFANNNVAPGWDLSIPVYFKHDVAGTIQEIQSQEEAKVISLGIKGTYLNNLIVNLAYSAYFGGSTDNLLRDRDNVALTIKYSL